MGRAAKVAAGVGALVIVLGAVGYWYVRAPSGASTEFGGSLAASAVPEFPSQNPEHWVLGSPVKLADARGSVILIEAWAPG